MINVANLSVTTDTFESWLEKTNLLCYYFSTYALTANSTLGVTTGNSYVNGVFSSNTLVALTDLRGGNNSVSNTLNITSNVTMQNTAALATGSLSFANTQAGQVVDSFSVSTLRTTKYLLQVNNAYGMQSTEIMLLPDGGGNVYSTEYATLSTNGSIATFSANVASGNVNLLITPGVNATSVKFERTSITV